MSKKTKQQTTTHHTRVIDINDLCSLFKIPGTAANFSMGLSSGMTVSGIDSNSKLIITWFETVDAIK